MEVGKPDEIGEVGEEALGTVSLPRPEGSLLSLMPLYLWVVVSTAFSGELQGFLESKWEWTKSGAYAGAFSLNVLSIFTLVLILQFLRHQFQPIRLQIVRGSSRSFPEDEYYEIWSHPNFFVRAFQRCLLVLGAIGATLLLLWGNPWAGPDQEYVSQIVGLLCLLSCLFIAFKLQGTLSQPLLAADARAVTLRSHAVKWERVQAVEIEHLTDVEGSFNAVKITLRDENKKKLGGVSIPAKSLSSTKENELLEFFAKVLGRRVLPVAPHSPDWI